MSISLADCKYVPKMHIIVVLVLYSSHEDAVCARRAEIPSSRYVLAKHRIGRSVVTVEGAGRYISLSCPPSSIANPFYGRGKADGESAV